MEFMIVLGGGEQKITVGEEIGNGILYIMLSVRGNYGLRNKFKNIRWII